MITFVTSDPAALLAAFKSDIASNNIRTWKDDGDGWYSHKAENWQGKAAIYPRQDPSLLHFRILLMGKRTKAEDRAVYSYYQSHLAETFINHFASKFSEVKITANPASSDSAEI